MTLNREKLKTILKEAFTDSFEKGGGKENRYFHGVRVARYCEKIAAAENLEVDNDALFLAGLFHDIGKIKAVGEAGYLDYGSEGNLKHHEIESRGLQTLISGLVQDDALLEEVAGIIREHHNRETVVTEALVLQDADGLDNFGYLQIWRTFNYAALGKLNFEESLNYWKAEGRKERQEMLKNFKFDATKQVAKKRFEKLDCFMNEIEKEDLGEDF